MADDAKGQEPNDSGQEPRTDQQGAAGAQGQEPERFDAEYVKKLRSEAAEYRRRLRELEQTVKQHEESKLSETEKLQKRLAELEREQANYQRERQERTLKYEVMLAASRMGIVDPEAAYKLLDLASIEFEEDGTPKNVEKALRDLIAKRPYLASGAAGSPMNPARGQSSPATFTRSQLRDPTFFKAHRDAIMQAMREGRIVEG
jgi:flagellar biosynthesis GTPase FlhF